MKNYKILDVEPMENYTIKLKYENGEEKLFNVLPYISGKWFEELRNINYFKTVHLTPDKKGIIWEHGQDIAPHELYDMGVPS
jgi:hypothetical protein